MRLHRAHRSDRATRAAAGLCALRAGFGLVLLRRPELLGRTLGVDSATASATGWLARLVGVREVAVGGGGLLAQGTARARPWVVAQAACDVGDALVLVAALRRRQLSPWTGWATVGFAVGGAAGGIELARRLAP